MSRWRWCATSPSSYRTVKRDYESVRDGLWLASDGSRIMKVNPRGLVLYAVTLPGARRPVWVHTLAEAKAFNNAAES